MSVETTVAEVTRVMGPPSAITLWFCPVCGARVSGHYNLDEGRKKCSKLWHKASVVGHRYVREGKS